MNNSDILIDIINDCVNKQIKKSNIPTKIIGRVMSVSDNGEEANVSIAGDDTIVTLLNKTGEVLKVGDNVFIESVNGNLTNGFISERFGNPVYTKVTTSVNIEYVQTDSGSDAPSTGWSTELPEYESGKYIWQRTVSVFSDGTSYTSAATCISGATSKGISNIVEQYYLSTSKHNQSDGKWEEIQPSWVENKYIWTRSKITWTDNSVTYTEPILANAINGANETANSKVGYNEIIASINKSSEGVQIQGEKVSLLGRNLNLTSENITINSDNFSVDANGNIDATSGNIGGFTLGKTEFTANTTLPYTYTSDDTETIKSIIMGEKSPTAEELEKYDLNQNGEINTLDWMWVIRFVNGSNTTNGKFKIDTLNSRKCLQLLDSNDVVRLSLGVFGSYIQSLTAGNFYSSNINTHTLSVSPENTDVSMYLGEITQNGVNRYGLSVTGDEYGIGYAQIGYSLYETSGESGNITLSQSAANFDYLEIFLQRAGNYSIKVSNPDGKTVIGTTSQNYDNNIYIYTKKMTISGNTISVDYNKGQSLSSSSSFTDDSHYITKVVGYK